MKNNLLFATLIAGIFTILTAASMLIHQAKKFQNPKEKEIVLALEFAKNEGHSENALEVWTNAKTNCEQRKVSVVAKTQRTLLLLDYPFLLSYSIFFGLSAFFFFQKTQHKVFLSGIAFAFLMGIGDSLENYQILCIISDYMQCIDPIGDQNNYQLLAFFTWLKWNSIGICFLLFAFSFFKEIKKSGFLLSKLLLLLICLGTFVSGALAFNTIYIQGQEVFPDSIGNKAAQQYFLSIIIGLFVLFIYLITVYRKQKKQIA